MKHLFNLMDYCVQCSCTRTEVEDNAVPLECPDNDRVSWMKFQMFQEAHDYPVMKALGVLPKETMH
jgi:hypothetical protein